MTSYLMLAGGHEVPAGYDLEDAVGIVQHARDNGNWLHLTDEEGNELRVDPRSVVAVRAA
jgi:hypothetical protein